MDDEIPLVPDQPSDPIQGLSQDPRGLEPSPIPLKKKLGGWKNPKAAANGFKGGCPIGAEKKTKRTYPPSDLIDGCVDNLLKGKKLIKLRRDTSLPVSERDAIMLKRISGLSVDEFNEHLSARLRTIADKTVSRLEEKIDQDLIKPESIAFTLAVIEDKRARLEGRNQLQNASVNIQVNNYGKQSKAELIKQLTE